MMFGKPVSNFWRVTLGGSEASSSPQNAAGSQGNEVRGDGAHVDSGHAGGRYSLETCVQCIQNAPNINMIFL